MCEPWTRGASDGARMRSDWEIRLKTGSYAAQRRNRAKCVCQEESLCCDRAGGPNRGQARLVERKRLRAVANDYFTRDNRR